MATRTRCGSAALACLLACRCRWACLDCVWGDDARAGIGRRPSPPRARTAFMLCETMYYFVGWGKACLSTYLAPESEHRFETSCWLVTRATHVSMQGWPLHSAMPCRLPPALASALAPSGPGLAQRVAFRRMPCLHCKIALLGARCAAASTVCPPAVMCAALTLGTNQHSPRRVRTT